MTVTFVASGTTDAGTTSITPGYPAGMAAQDLMILTVINKHPPNIPTTPTGWILRKRQSGGQGASGADAGQVYCSVYTKVADGTESGTLTVTITSGNSAQGRITAYRKTTANGLWSLDVASGSDETIGTAWSAVTDTLSVRPTDWIFAASGHNSDVPTFSAETVTMAGVGFGTNTERTDTNTALGNDLGIVLSDHVVSTGTVNVAATYAMTASSSAGSYPTGATVLLRMGDEVANPGPVATIEIGFATTPFATATTWSDVTAYVDQQNYPIQIERGRADPGSEVTPSTMTLVLNNDDKRFTPGYTGGTYGSGVKPNRRIRVSVLHNGTTYYRFTGYITSYDLSWPGGVTNQARVMVTATDMLGMMSQVTLRNLVEHTYLTSGPVALWPLDDARNASDAHEVSQYAQPALHYVKRGHGATARFDGAESIPAIPDRDSRAVKFKSMRDNDLWTALGETISTQSATTSLGIGYWIRYDEDDDDVGDVPHATASLDGTYALLIGVHNSHRIFASLVDTGGVKTWTPVYGRHMSDGAWHFVYAVYTETGSGVITLYVDGISQGSSAAFGGGFPTISSTSQVTIGAGRESDGNKIANSPTNVRMAYAGIWTDTTATALDTATLYEAGHAGWDRKDRTSARVSRVLDWYGFQSALRDIERGLSEVRIGDMASMTMFDYLNQCVAGEQGFLFVQGDGDVAFHARDHRWDATSTTFLTWHNPGESFTTDVEQTVNTVIVAHDNGHVKVSNAASRLDYGPREFSVDTQLTDRNQAYGIATYILKLRETLRPRLSAFRAELESDPSEMNRDAILALDLGSMFTIASTPTQAHADTFDVWVEGICETISLDDWSVTFTTTPHKSEFSGYWVLGTTANDLLDTNTGLGY